MKLHSYWRSSCSYRVRIALAYKGLEYRYAGVDLRSADAIGAFTARNPLRQVPVLELDDGTCLTQSLPIVEYLEEIRPEPALLPPEPVARAQARALAEIVNSGTQPLQNVFVLDTLEAQYGGDRQRWARMFVERGLAALETQARETAGTFLVGDAVTIADVWLIPQLYNARRLALPCDSYPTLQRVAATCDELPAFAAAAPERQPDAP